MNRKLLLLILATATCSAACSAPRMASYHSTPRMASHSGKPIIGIVAGYSNGASRVGIDYCVSIREAGGIPVVIPAVGSKKEAKETVQLIDGLLMTGGEDINPEYYGEEPVNETVDINGVRDTSEFFLLSAAKKRQIPVMGICRGEQVVNVFYGGSLIQDIPSQAPSEIAHNQDTPKAEGTHWIYLKEGTKLKALLQKDSILVNSFHHQAVKEPAKGFIVSATSADGIVEAYETPEGAPQKIICVQFHPEGFIYKGDHTLLPLFKEFVGSCKSFKDIR